jgi:hypothetical protein
MAKEKPEKDVGAHYRYSFTRKLTPAEKRSGQVTVKMDPYRICDIYKVGGGPREHIIKKALRGREKCHSEEELINELQSCLDRWKEMVKGI